MGSRGTDEIKVKLVDPTMKRRGSTILRVVGISKYYSQKPRNGMGIGRLVFFLGVGARI